jgi:hypothetical protein
MKILTTRAGIELKPKEIRLTNRLKKLANDWNKDGKRLWLFSASGTLHVMLDECKGNPHPRMTSLNGGGVNPDNIVCYIPIANDGGDW